MTNWMFIKRDLKDILACKSEGGREVFIYEENKEFFEELLEKTFNTTNIITEKDVTILQEYLDYINMIED